LPDNGGDVVVVRERMKTWMLLLVLVPGCTSDFAAVPVISRAVVHIDLAQPDEPPAVDVALTLVGGDEPHTTVLDKIYIGRGPFDQERDLALYLPTPTVVMEPRSQQVISLVGELARADFIGHCQSTLPIGAIMSFEDTPDLVVFSPTAQLVVFCD
jgi:hypothetical protein